MSLAGRRGWGGGGAVSAVTAVRSAVAWPALARVSRRPILPPAGAVVVRTQSTISSSSSSSSSSSTVPQQADPKSLRVPVSRDNHNNSVRGGNNSNKKPPSNGTFQRGPRRTPEGAVHLALRAADRAWRAADAASLGPLLERAEYRPDHADVLLQFAHSAGPVAVSTLWLRDSCACPLCVTPSSGQKRFNTVELPQRPRVLDVDVDTDQGLLRVTWDTDAVAAAAAREDGRGQATDTTTTPHVSTFDAEALLHRLARMPPPAVLPAVPPRKLWDRARLTRALRPVAFADWIAGGAEFWRALTDLHQLGILLVDGVPPTYGGKTEEGDANQNAAVAPAPAVLAVAEQIGVVQTTFYGQVFDVVSKPAAENVAYTSGFLGLHQDLLYMQDAPYIQLLHCRENSCAGGASLFSDSVRAAYELALRHPAHVAPLAARRIGYHYERNGHYYFHPRGRAVLERSGGPLGSKHAFAQTAWSPPFQDVLPWPGATMVGVEAEEAPPPPPPVNQDLDLARWHTAAGVFRDLVEAPANVFEVKLEPGQCVLFNNRRVLHGRRAFDTGAGQRWLQGAYLAEQTFASKVLAMVREGRYTPPTGDGAPAGGLRPSLRQTYESECSQVERMLEEQVQQE